MRTEGNLLWPNVVASWHGLSWELSANAEFVGGRAVGLLMLPRSWVPPFVVLTRAFCGLFRETKSTAKAFAKISRQERALIDAMLPDSAIVGARGMKPA